MVVQAAMPLAQGDPWTASGAGHTVMTKYYFAYQIIALHGLTTSRKQELSTLPQFQDARGARLAVCSQRRPQNVDYFREDPLKAWSVEERVTPFLPNGKFGAEGGIRLTPHNLPKIG